jgi:hypothetical protein
MSMTPTTLICPQCGGALPRQALWRTVTCSYCLAEVTLAKNVVHAADFRAAWLRSRAGTEFATMVCAGQHYKTLAQLGSGSSAKVILAERVGAMAQRVVLKVAHAGTAAGQFAREKDILDQLQSDTSPGAAYFTQRLPQPVALGSLQDTAGERQDVLVLRNPTGFWGSLADVKRHYAQGIDPRHAVWMWRRVLEVLAHVHAGGWSHGRLGPEHLLVHPADHGVLIIGWAGARRCRYGGPEQARDLMQLAWAMRALLSDIWDEPPLARSTPAPLAHLLEQASSNATWVATQGAEGLNQLLGRAAREAFGPSRFIDFSPTQSNSPGKAS